MNDITHEREEQEAVVTKKLEHKNEMGKAIMRAQEEERKLLRTELHEDINQVLASIKLCFHDIYNQGKADELVKEGIAQLDEVIFKIRKISNTLSPSGLEYFGIIASIKDIISFKETVYPVTFRFTHHAFTDERIQKELGIFIYRIITDLINNMFFADNEKPSEIAIDIKNAGKQLQIAISDNSPITDVQALVSQRNIAGLQNKLEMYNGRIDVSIENDKRIVTKISLNT
jgi:two-component system sensor histidine kinase UhpB